MDRIKKELGKIKSASFGRGGYQDVQIGISFSFSGGDSGWGTGDFWGFWDGERSDSADWSEADRIAYLGMMVMRLDQLLLDAKVFDVAKLVGVPVEVTFNGNRMQSWRILTEVV